MAGHSRSKNGVAEFTLGLAEGKTRGLAYVPAVRVFRDTARKSWMPAFAGMTERFDASGKRYSAASSSGLRRRARREGKIKKGSRP